MSAITPTQWENAKLNLAHAAYVQKMEAAASTMLAALQTTRLQLHVALAGKEALSIEKQLSIVDAAIIQAEQAGIKTGEVK